MNKQQLSLIPTIPFNGTEIGQISILNTFMGTLLTRKRYAKFGTLKSIVNIGPLTGPQDQQRIPKVHHKLIKSIHQNIIFTGFYAVNLRSEIITLSNRYK